MILNPIDVVKLFPVRKSRRQKALFRDEITRYAQCLGYAVSEEKGSFGSRNWVAGDPEHAQYVITAHYDTCAAMPLPNLLTPCSLLGFLGWQLIMTVVLLIPVFLVGFLVGYRLQSGSAGYFAGYFLFLAVTVLMLVGPANKNNANDNTSGVVTVLELLKSMPEKERNRVCFVLFDLEEAGLIGSASYRKRHKKASNSQVVFNLDCVGDGDSILFFLPKAVRKQKSLTKCLEGCSGQYGQKSISLVKKGFSVYPSDQKHFPYGIAIAAFHQAPFVGPYVSKIHTKRDTVLDITNVNILRACLISVIGVGCADFRKDKEYETV